MELACGFPSNQSAKVWTPSAERNPRLAGILCARQQLLVRLATKAPLEVLEPKDLQLISWMLLTLQKV